MPDRKTPILFKAGLIIVAVWLLNVAFVAVHELGHASLATYFGGKVFQVYISPIGYNGATSYTSLTSIFEGRLVIAGGLIAAIITTLAAYLLKTELPVYVIGLRTVESLTNYTMGSDMTSLAGWIGWQSYALSFFTAGLIMLCIVRTMYCYRLKTIADMPA
jgi:hypothetical protein